MIKVIPILLLISMSCFQNQKKELKSKISTSQLQKHLNAFVDSEWQKVFQAKDSLMIFEKEAIPHLIELMNDEKRFVKLKNTADLIYPGTTEFYGHGWVISYDLDWVAIRAGWALEELTFKDFGFVDNSITDRDLIQLHKDNYEEYIQTGKHDVDFERKSFKQLSKSIDKVKGWWLQNKDDWTNLTAIKEAIYSTDVNRQMNALQHLRYPNYESKGLTNEYFERVLKPRLKELSLSRNEEIANQAKLKLSEQ